LNFSGTLFSCARSFDGAYRLQAGDFTVSMGPDGARALAEGGASIRTRAEVAVGSGRGRSILHGDHDEPPGTGYPHDRVGGRDVMVVSTTAEAATRAAKMTAPRLGTAPTLREDLDRALDLIAAMGERIAVLEAARDADAGEDGPPPQPLPDNWKPLPEAAEIAGYSWSGLRKKITTLRDGPWWKRRSNRILIDVTAMPRKPTV
jgi:hypothetical protein